MRRAQRPVPSDKLRFLAETVVAEAALLNGTDRRLFALPMDSDRARTLRDDVELAERVDAFVARFGRLQDSLGDKLLPGLLDWLAEAVAAAIDNLSRAERRGLIGSSQGWLEARQLRNRMIHESVRDPAPLAAALNAAHLAVPMLLAAAARMAAGINTGMPPATPG